MHGALGEFPAWIVAPATLAGVALIALVAQQAVFRVLRLLLRRRDADLVWITRTDAPASAIVPLVVLVAGLPVVPLPGVIGTGARHLASLALIAAAGWLATRSVDALVSSIGRRFPTDRPDNLQARRVHTQLRLLQRISLVVIVVIVVSLMLMTFPGVARLGTTLFASAGVAGLVIGIAARPTLSNLIAGVQVALAEPIRIDDVVVVEGEWGWVEEIGTTYVVVRIWDLRRLVLPITYFIEKPFQNWTRTTADILGTVFVYADYMLPVEAVREELHRILQASGMWDDKAWGLQVTDADRNTVQLRALMSAPDSSRAWDLRCHVREKLIAFLQREYPQHLPRTRVELERDTGPAAPD
ncbi:MAG TPA: mechanosensitive ion channel domain-containing protein [Gammaproteobacteria bacterium]|nr:mechanosensitive ion channel domain-containing protein [Gammaproteobacteria bacterium]